MRILWLSHVVPFPPKAGVLLRAYYLLKNLATTHDVELVAFVQRPLLGIFYPDIDRGLEECRRELLKHCRSVTFLPIDRAERKFGKVRTAAESLFCRDGYMASWLVSSPARTAIGKIVDHNDFELAHFDNVGLAPYRDLIPDIPATLGHHNAESHMLRRRAELATNPLRKWYFQHEAMCLARYENIVAERFRLHITCSELDSERLRESMPAARLLAIPNGVDTAFFTPRGGAQIPNSIAFVGTLSWYPNAEAIEYMLRDVWPRLRARMPDATFDVVGAGAPNAITEMAARTPGVTMHGYVPDIRPIVERAALIVCPIRDGGGTKLKILDALAMAKCIVAHPIACEGIDVTPDKDVIFAETPIEFAAQIEKLLHDDERRRSLGAAARALAEQKYSFATIGQRFVTALVGARCASI